MSDDDMSPLTDNCNQNLQQVRIRNKRYLLITLIPKLSIKHIAVKMQQKFEIRSQNIRCH